MTDNEIIKEYNKYSSRFLHKDLMEHLNPCLTYRAKLDNPTHDVTDSYYFKHYYELVHTSLKDEAVNKRISQEIFLYLSNLCLE